ncbi:hypothetical protein BKA65DRAFT_593679 [Rhexocercosporidium sp. MPI-PUGE-AT-0058]|nr:hypothetical protein BKA65DRAFT_593679 [Rhexocercosporidium sp. MPI-PUGE-AT-0058]
MDSSVHSRARSGSIKRVVRPRNGRITTLLDEVGLSSPQRIPPLTAPPYCEFDASISSNVDKARSVLVEQRTSGFGYKQPDQQRRHIFRSKKTKDAKCNSANWKFTNHEVAKAFDCILSQTPLPVPGVAQALLAHASVKSLDELWAHFYDPELEKRMPGNNSKKPNLSVLPNSISSMRLNTKPSMILSSRSGVASRKTNTMNPHITWLDEVCHQGNLEYIQLLCQAGLSQEALSRAFGISLLMHSVKAMQVLLSFGAIVSADSQDLIEERLKNNDTDLVKILLSAPNAMSSETWRTTLDLDTQSSEAIWIRLPAILLLCLFHRPELGNSQLLQNALELHNYPTMVVVLCYGDFRAGLPRNFCRQACEIVCLVDDDERRHQFFKILNEFKFVEDSPILRRELLKCVQNRQLPMVKLLVDAGVVVDMEPHNSFRWAVSHQEFEVLELFKGCIFTSPIAQALELMPESSSESDMLRLVEFLSPLGLAGEPLDRSLVQAVQKQQSRLVETLILQGASIEFAEAAVIHTALQSKNLDMLNTLLRNQCSAQLLSTTIPTAISLQPRRIRLQAMKALVQKGILVHDLGRPLQTLVSEEGDVDSELIQFLLQSKAPIEGVGSDASNALLTATRKGALSTLEMLCNANSYHETVSKAVPIAFGTIGSCGDDVALSMIRLLLRKGASGSPIHQTLLYAVKADKLDIVRVLLKHGADANHATGGCFQIALEMKNLNLLRLLCASCPPSQLTVEANLFVALDPRYYQSDVLQLLLTSGRYAKVALNKIFSPEKLKGNPNNAVIIPLLLSHGLDVNIQGGDLLSFAIKEKNIDLLQKILSANPNTASLTAAFHKVTVVKSKILELTVMNLLLEKAKSVDIGQSAAVSRHIRLAASGDFYGLRLLLRHNAVITPENLRKACLATASSTKSWTEKQELIEDLFTRCAKVSKDEMSTLLVGSITFFSKCPQLPQLLVTRGAEVTFEGLKAVIEEGSFDLLRVLLGSIRNVDTATKTFQRVRQIAMVQDRRYLIYQYLLKKGVPKDDISEALLCSLERDGLDDLSIPKLLLELGASPAYKKGESVSIAIRANSPKSLQVVRLLCQYIIDDSMATAIFNVVLQNTLLKRDIQMEIYRPLLEWKIDKSSLSQALLDNFNGNRPDLPFITLLLAKGADPSKGSGHCFAVAAKKETVTEFRLLCRHASRRVVLKVLLKRFKEEKEVVKWFGVYLEENERSGKISQDELIFLCLRKFPAGTILLKLLLENGLSVSAKIDHCICPDWKAESCTVLIWALLQIPRIENNTILELLAQRNNVLPAYSTPQSKISAAFLCLLDRTRIPILKALLDMDRDGVSECVIPGSSFVPLAMPPEIVKKDSDQPHTQEELPLQLASLYLGNFEAFQLIASEITPNDSTLHLAAVLALPKFVNWLLESHDPNHQVEEFDNMIPLALACASKPDPCCKIANEEASWRERQEETMHLLADVTDSKWRYRHMTILHYSMDNGLETAKAIVKALDISHDPEKDKKYLYTDREGVKYTPEEYITKLWGASEADKKALIACLQSPSPGYGFFFPTVRPPPKIPKKWTPAKAHVPTPDPHVRPRKAARRPSRGHAKAAPAVETGVPAAWTTGEALFGTHLAPKAGVMPGRWPDHTRG